MREQEQPAFGDGKPERRVVWTFAFAMIGLGFAAVHLIVVQGRTAEAIRLVNVVGPIIAIMGGLTLLAIACHRAMATAGGRSTEP